MSCRVLKREMENSMMNALVEKARKCNASKIIGYYFPTSKNGMVKEFYGTMGFVKINEDIDGNTEWELDVDQYVMKEAHMKIESFI